jgi:hypothetical protein
MSTSADGTITIDCEDCAMRDSDTCGTCVVTFICDRDPGDALVIDVEERRALRLLGQSGLVPLLCHSRAAS